MQVRRLGLPEKATGARALVLLRWVKGWGLRWLQVWQYHIIWLAHVNCWRARFFYDLKFTFASHIILLSDYIHEWIDNADGKGVNVWGKGPGFDPRSSNFAFFLLFLASSNTWHLNTSIMHLQISIIGSYTIQIQRPAINPHGGPANTSPTGSQTRVLGLCWPGPSIFSTCTPKLL